MTNVESPIEGVLSVREGTQLCAQPSIGSTNAYLHTMARLVVTNTATTRYLGIGLQIYRSTSAVGVGMSFSVLALPPFVASVATSSNVMLQRWEDADYGSEGYILAYKFFACPNAMLKDNGSLNPLQTWGVFPPQRPATATNSGAGSGPPAFTGAEVPYTYAYTYLNPISGAESNPSIPMPASIGVSPDGTAINVTVRGDDDPQIPTYTQSINIYRAGGSFGDGLYRFVGSVINSGSPAIPVVFSDTLLDQDIISNTLLSTDNDPPVPAGLPIEFIAVTTKTGVAGSVIIATYTLQQGPPGFFPKGGDLLYIATGLSSYEEAICITNDSASLTISFYTQLGQAAVPYTIICTTATGSPASLALTAFNSVFLAGDAYNPSFLYQSKPNQPESFPVIQQSTGIIQSISVGTPANPINGITQYGGSVVCLNLENIFIVAVYNNQMQSPVQTPARHGLITRNAWVKVSNEIWYLSYDGIYSFAGGQETWVSEAIDPLFKGQSMNGYLPINMIPGLGGSTPPVGLDVITMTTVDNNIVMNYTDTAGTPWRLVYELNFKRWHIEQFHQGTYGLYMQYSEPDTGNSWIGLNVPNNPYTVPVLELTDTGTTDGWTASPISGTPISYEISPTVFDQKAQTDKLFSDFQVELSASDTVTVNTRYNWNTTNDAIDVFTIAGGPRQRYPLPLQAEFAGSSQNPLGSYAYAMQLLFSGNATGATSLYTLGIHYEDLTDYRAGMSMDFSDLGYPDDKIIRGATIEIDTGGVQATGYLDVDGQVPIAQFLITTTYNDRKRIVTFPSNMAFVPPLSIIGKMVRLRFAPGPNGRTNWYKCDWDFLKEPPAVLYFDSFEFSFNWDGYNFVKQIWMCYTCQSPITFNLYVDDSVLFWTQTLPAQPTRDVTRFYLPSVNAAVLNKSKVKRFTMAAATAFKVYGMSSRMEWLPCGSDQRQDYEQFALTEMMGPQ